MGRCHRHKAHILDLVSPTPERRLFGSAVTIRFLPFRSDIVDADRHNMARMLYLALGDGAPATKVLVMSSAGYRETSVGGGTKLSRLHNLRMAGLITDGRLRDFNELGSYSFATYCSGETTRWGGDELMPFAAGVPVALSGVTVIPGDYIFADAAGAVVIPRGEIDWVLDEAIRIERDDAAYVEAIRVEDPEVILKGGSKER